MAQRSPRRSDAELSKLYQKHWAIEIVGRYHELAQRDGAFRFSAAYVVKRDTRGVVSRMFIGSSRTEMQILKAVGKYSLREICHTRVLFGVS